MRVVVDGSPLCYPLTGIGYYTHSLLSALAEARPEWEFIVLSPYHPTSPVILPNVSHDLKLSRAIETRKMGWRSWWFDMILPKAVHSLAADVFWATDGLVPFCLSGTAVALTIYDFVPERFPETMALLPRLYRKWNLRHWLTRASVLLPISEATAAEAFSLFGVTTHAVVYPGVDEIFLNHREPEEEIGASGILDYFITLGTIEPRKNLIALINCVDALVQNGVWPSGLTLRIVGGKGWRDTLIHEKIAQLETKGVIQSLGYVPRESLPGLLAGARALLMPSLYEGFGMPIAEAMAVGCPVICSDIPPFREMIGGGPALFHTTAESSIYEAYKKAVELNPTPAHSQLVRHSETKFTWGQSAAEFIRAIENA